MPTWRIFYFFLFNKYTADTASNPPKIVVHSGFSPSIIQLLNMALAGTKNIKELALAEPSLEDAIKYTVVPKDVEIEAK